MINQATNTNPDIGYLIDIAAHKGLRIRTNAVEGAPTTYDVILPIGSPVTGKSRGELIAFLHRY